MQPLTRHDHRELRFFALGLALLLVVAFWWFIPWLRDRPHPPLWPLIAAWLLVMAAWVHPPSILPLHRAFLPVARVLAWVNTWLLLGAVFLAILLPLGWVLRRLGKLQYTTGFDERAATYRVTVPPGHEARLKDPF